MNKVTVQIFGQDYTITGSRSEAEIRKIADRVDQQMKAISKASSYSGTSNIAVLSAINISEALLDAEKEVRKLNNEKEKIAANASYYMNMLDKAKKNTKQTRESAGEQEQKVKEYEEMLRQASEKCKEYENSIFDLQMANVKLKNEIDKLKGEQ